MHISYVGVNVYPYVSSPSNFKPVHWWCLILYGAFWRFRASGLPFTMVFPYEKATRKPHNPYQVGPKNPPIKGDFLGTSPRTWDLVMYGFRRKTIGFPHT